MWLAAVIVLGQLFAPAPGRAADVASARHFDAGSAVSQCVPTQAGTAAGLNLASAGRLGSAYPDLPRIGVDSAIVPATLLKAIAWVESNWIQYESDELPLISYDWGYGIMQITYGMPGASGPEGTIKLSTEAGIAGDYKYNVAYGARVLVQYFKHYPAINDRDPTAIEDWYYALMAYNGFGANNPNGDWSRLGTPATNAGAFPYQERVFYWVAHPPLGENGRPLWTPMHVTVPPSREIVSPPTPLHIHPVHRQIPHVFGATYDVPTGLTEMAAGSSVIATVTAYNAGALPWTYNSTDKYSLMYHWVQPASPGTAGYDPQLGGVDVGDDTAPVRISQETPVAGSITLPVKIVTPATTGKLLLEWDMVDKMQGWFSRNGAAPAKQAVRIVPAGQSVPPYQDPPPPAYLSGNHSWFWGTTSADVPAKLQPKQVYSETALLFNPGATRWGFGYHLQRMNRLTSIALPLSAVLPCRLIPITIEANAPNKPGTYTDHWRMETASNTPFGKPIAITYTVVPKSKPTSSSAHAIRSSLIS